MTAELSTSCEDRRVPRAPGPEGTPVGATRDGALAPSEAFRLSTRAGAVLSIRRLVVGRCPPIVELTVVESAGGPESELRLTAAEGLTLALERAARVRGLVQSASPNATTEGPP